MSSYPPLFNIGLPSLLLRQKSDAKNSTIEVAYCIIYT